MHYLWVCEGDGRRKQGESKIAGISHDVDENKRAAKRLFDISHDVDENTTS